MQHPETMALGEGGGEEGPSGPPDGRDAGAIGRSNVAFSGQMRRPAHQVLRLAGTPKRAETWAREHARERALGAGDDYGDTPLHLAAWSGGRRTLEWLAGVCVRERVTPFPPLTH